MACASSQASPVQTQTTQAIEVIEPRHAPTVPILFSCEHATQILPARMSWEKDSRLMNAHWSFDPGARDFTLELSEQLGHVPCILSRFSRLVLDPNRPLSSDTLIRQVADNQPVTFNQDLSQEQVEQRIQEFYEPYHKAYTALVQKFQPKFILSIHSFTDSYEGQKREVEIGVLFNKYVEPATKIAQHLQREGGYIVRMNEPWSGKDGFQFAADLHAADATRTECVPFMVELRQDLLTRVEWRARAVEVMAQALRAACAP